jgi:hypothetical protein
MKRARDFYEGVLNLKPTTVTNSEHGQWTEYEFGPYALAIGCAPGFKANPDGCSAALEVEDFDAASRKSGSAHRSSNVKAGDVAPFEKRDAMKGAA